MDKTPTTTYDLPNEGARVPPQAIQVEESVLGGMLIDPEARDVAFSNLGTDSSVFYRPGHQHIFEQMLALYNEDKDFDLLTVESRLRDKGLLESIGGPGYLSELTRSFSSVSHVEDHCLILLEKWVKRQLILDASNTQKEAYDSETDPFDVLDKSMTRIDAVADRLYRRSGIFVSDMLKQVLSDIEHRRENPGLSGVPFGLALDKYTGGFQPGNLYYIAARPSVGKSALALKGGFNAAMFEAETYRTNVAFFNLEMKNEDLIKRRLAMEAGVNYTKMRDGKVTDGEMKRLVEMAGRLYDTRMIIDDTAGIHISEARAKIKTWKRRHDIGLVIIDYLQLMTGDGSGNREQEIASISKGLKAAAKESNVPVVALSQLSREPEKREGGEPYLSDLRESGSLEQDADGVIFLYRPEMYDCKRFKETETKNRGWVKVAKMRNGATGEFTMRFIKMYADWQNEHSEEYSDNPEDDIAPPSVPKPYNPGSDDYAPF